ncbi:hypothetical protein [Thermoactinomyces mirandus]|uniref:Uncharacterized protein n=1 Tax=Thermoactinomyces mirandus TaxID=2756294 RepID=A0A7W2ATJ9_9BACL|nr:hypothetical protein [Thermoactinomyces mirandus]MBA4603591.1 hypothetical protein [Thermoactinomyces mirandus]
MNRPRILPRISFKGVFVFVTILFSGILFIPAPLKYIHLSETMSYFLAAGISSSIGMSIVLSKIDGKTNDRLLLKKRILLSIVVGFATSALMTFVFGGDILE